MANKIPRVPVREQNPRVRATNFDEVCYGYDLNEAQLEASRCLNCKKPQCMAHCPVSIKIPNFITKVLAGDLAGAAAVIAEDSSLPSVCGRVCPQEAQCEGACVLGIKGEPVAIGKLERFVGDWELEHGSSQRAAVASNGHKVAVIGSGPSGLACAADLAKMGYEVTVFEALHKLGETDTIVGRTVTIDGLMRDEGFEAVFIGSGAGLPKFMGIPGENLNGVLSANEFLTRNNLMKAYLEESDTPVYVGERTVVVGGGNVAMDAVRTAKRLGADAYIVYRRSEAELPARLEEVHHAKEEGVQFVMLANPLEILGNEEGWVRGVRCIRMELGEPDESGRRSPKAVPGSEFEIPCDTVIMSLGTSPNPLIASTTEGLQTTRWGGLIANDEGATTREGVFAGGDAVTGAATVILAMGAGRKAAAAIDAYIQGKGAQ